MASADAIVATLLRFRTVLVVALLGILTLTAALVATTSYVNARRNAVALSEQVLSQAALRAAARVHTQLDVAVAQSELHQRLLASGDLDPRNQAPLARHFADALGAEPSLTFLSFTLDENANHTFAHRADDGTLDARILTRQPQGALALTDYRVSGGQLERVRALPDTPENDERPRPFYVAAKERGAPVWLETYTFYALEPERSIPGVTYATPVLKDGALVGVLTADFDLRALSRYLSTLDVLEHGIAFVIEHRKDGTRRLIAHPSWETVLKLGSDGAAQALDVERVSDPRVTALARALPPATQPSKDKSTVRFSLGDTPFVGGYQTLEQGDLRWTVAVVAPEEDVLAEVRRANRTAAGIILIGTVLAFIVASALGAYLARPLRRLADETEAIARFELSPSKDPASPFLEVSRLSASMEEMKRGLRSFRKYIPAELVHELLSSGREAEVGGERRTLTIHFSDIAGFTTVAEGMPPERLVAYLGDYLGAMTEPIHRSGGTVDKYIGDAIMAFWGAPKQDDDHALHACEAALENRDRLLALNAEWESAGRPRLDARAALHTGEVIVGNVGTGKKLDYTAIGDAVNLASRLEGLNKKYGTRLMISETTWACVKDKMIARPLDRVSVKGKSKSVEVFELIGRRGEVSADDEAFAAAFAEAFAAYVARRWPDATAKLETLLRGRPTDEAARVLLERCRRFEKEPPEDDWDGAEKMTTK
jgi:adenylate cyclase